MATAQHVSPPFDTHQKLLNANFARSTIRGRLFSTSNDIEPRYILLSVEEVKDLLEKRHKNGVMLFDTCYQADDNKLEFVKDHIEGAQFFGIEDVVYQTKTKKRNLVHPLEFQSYVRHLGINQDSSVILYDHAEVNRSIINATYAHWLFSVYGHNRVAIMNGGLTAWKSRGLPTVSGEVSPGPEGNFLARWNADQIATFPEMLQLLESNGDYMFIDSRIPEQFSGNEKVEMAQHGGRMPGSVNLPVADFITKDEFYLIGRSEFLKLLQKYGIPVPREKGYLCSCNTAFQSTGLHFLLRQAGIESKIYDGSWVEWSWLGPDKFKDPPTEYRVKAHI